MYYRFALIGNLIAPVRLSASRDIYVFLMRYRRKALRDRMPAAAHAFAYAAATVVALRRLVKTPRRPTYTASSIATVSPMFAILAALFTGGAAISIASRALPLDVNAVYAVDLLGAGAGCLLLAGPEDVGPRRGSASATPRRCRGRSASASATTAPHRDPGRCRCSPSRWLRHRPRQAICGASTTKGHENDRASVRANGTRSRGSAVRGLVGTHGR